MARRVILVYGLPIGRPGKRAESQIESARDTLAKCRRTDGPCGNSLWNGPGEGIDRPARGSQNSRDKGPFLVNSISLYGRGRFQKNLDKEEANETDKGRGRASVDVLRD